MASELLKVGLASSVAMSHSVLVETARRFVEAFYEALVAGRRVCDAMLAGQRRLKDDTFRGQIFGAGTLQLEDWSVPVLFQEKDDPQLFKITPAKQTVEDFKSALATRLGELPPVPETGFIGRSRELLSLQRLLRAERYAVVRGQGGEGKTALAAEFACWMVHSQQVRRTAFVSVVRWLMCLAGSWSTRSSLQLAISKSRSRKSSARFGSRRPCWWWTTRRASFPRRLLSRGRRKSFPKTHTRS